MNVLEINKHINKHYIEMLAWGFLLGRIMLWPCSFFLHRSFGVAQAAPSAPPASSPDMRSASVPAAPAANMSLPPDEVGCVIPTTR